MQVLEDDGVKHTATRTALRAFGDINKLSWNCFAFLLFSLCFHFSFLPSPSPIIMRTLTPARAALGVLFTLAGAQVFALDSRHNPLGNRPVMKIRQADASTAAASTTAAAAATTTAAAAATTTTQQKVEATTTAAAATTAQASTTAAAAASTTQQQASQSAAQTTAAQTNAPATTQQQQNPTPTSFTSAFVTTKQGGQVVTSIVVVSESPAASASGSQSAVAANSSSGSDSGSSGVSSSTIIGLSVAGGVAVLGLIGFFIWKFTRKRMHDFGGGTCAIVFSLATITTLY